MAILSFLNRDLYIEKKKKKKIQEQETQRNLKDLF